jgi:hypothetical protein
MTNPTRQEIIDAYETLDMLLGFSEDRNPDLVPERRRIIEKALPPRPQPTMADVEWDDDLHYLAEAEHKSCGKVIMLGLDEDGLVEFFIPKARASRYDAAYRGSLTLTGRRYELTEAQDD